MRARDPIVHGALFFGPRGLCAARMYAMLMLLVL